MKKIKKLASLLFCCLFLYLLAFPGQAWAASLIPTAQDNLSVSLRRSSDLISTSDGYMRVFRKTNSVGIEYYDNSLQITGKREIPMELPLWGGFYAGSDGYYLVEGQNNTAEDNSAEVIRVIRYDTNWNRNGAASITSNPDLFGGEVRYPFDYGCVEMTETNGTLYIVTGHEGYVDESVGQGHQGFLMIAVDQASMTGKIVSCDLWHSFAQYIKSQSSYLYVLEQSEGSRCTKLSRYDSATLKKKTIEILPYGGSHTSVWSIACYASVDGMAVSSDSVLCIGTTIDQSQYDNVTSDTPHNIYLTITPVSDFSEEATSVKYLTSYTGNGKSFMGVKITPITENRFMISWEEYENTEDEDDSSAGNYASADDSLSSSTLHYLFIDGKGNVLSKEYTTAAPVSDCQPIIKDSKVVYYASNANTVNFYSIDANDGTASKKIYRTAGENATWDFTNGVLTISGQGPLNISTSENQRFPISSTQGGYSYWNDTAWKSMKNQVKKIVIKSGITSISENAFNYLPNLKEVVVENGVRTIGKEAFAFCYNLEKVTLPDSVVTIGDDIVWEGSYWYSGGHVYYATIYASYNSAAITYARKNNIRYACDLSKASVTGVKKTYAYTGKSLKPVPKITLGKQKLTAGQDYKVTYSNNKKVGTATVKITGQNNYFGTITLKFQITKSSNGKDDKPQTTVVKTFSDSYNVYTVNKNGTSVTLKQPKTKTITTATIPSSVKANGRTYKVTAIASGAFKNCRNLKQVTITKNISSIGTSAFQGCSTLRTVKIGTKVSSIGAKAFYDCKALTSVTIQSKKLTSGTIGKSAFTKAGRNNYKNLKVKVPASKLSTYKKLLKSKGLSAKAKVSK